MTRRITLLAIVLPIAGLIAWYFFALHAIRGMVGMALWSYTDCCTVTLGRPFFRLNGEIGVRDLRIVPLDADYGEPIEIEEVVLSTPGFLWTQEAFFGSSRSGGRKGSRLSRMARSAASREEERAAPLPAAKHLSITLKNAKLGMGGLLPESLDDLGLATAAPFEAEGCVGDVYWADSEMGLLGLSSEPVTATFGYRVTGGDEVTVTATLSAPGRGSGEVTRRIRTPDPEHYLFTDPEQERLLDDRLEVRDMGFVKARNAYCAKRDGIGEAEFVDRHLKSVQRLLLEHGMVPTPELERVYRGYATGGGRLIYHAKPHPSVDFDKYHLYSAAQRFDLWNGTLRSLAGETKIQLSPAEIRPFPEDFDGSTWDLVASEEKDGLVLAARPFDGEAQFAEAGQDPHQRKRAPKAVAASEEPAATPRAPARAAELAPAVVEAARADRFIPLATLGEHVGDPIRVLDANGRRHTGVLRHADAQSLVIRVRGSGGYADYTLAFDRVQSVEAMRKVRN